MNTPQTHNHWHLLERVPLNEHVQLAEFSLNGHRVNLRSIVESEICFPLRTVAVLSRNKNVMEGRHDLIRAHTAAAEAFPGSVPICEKVRSDWIYILVEAPHIEVSLVEAYRRDYWVLVASISSEELKASFDSLAMALARSNLEEQVSLLLEKVELCCRLWREGEQRIFQIFSRREIAEKTRKELGIDSPSET